jgi:hypothetical protein
MPQFFLLLTLFLSVFTTSHPVRAASEIEATAQLEAAKKYARIASVAGILQDAVNSLAKQVPVEQRDAFIAALIENIDVKRLERLMIDSLNKQFTLKELNALADFYGSSEGKKILRKLGTVMSELQPEIQKEIMTAIQKSKKAEKPE